MCATCLGTLLTLLWICPLLCLRYLYHLVVLLLPLLLRTLRFGELQSLGHVATLPPSHTQLRKVCTGSRCLRWCLSSTILRGALLTSCLRLARVVRGAAFLFPH